MRTPVGVLPGEPAGVPAFCAALAGRATTEKVANYCNTVNRDMKGLTLLVAGMLADMGKLDPDDSRPPYRQIADTLRAAIESGDLAPGAQLPALPALMDEYAVSLGTVRNALAALRDAGLIVTRQGKGSYVRTQRAPDAEDELTNLRRVVEALTVRLDDVERRLAEMAG